MVVNVIVVLKCQNEELTEALQVVFNTMFEIKNSVCEKSLQHCTTGEKIQIHNFSTAIFI